MRLASFLIYLIVELKDERKFPWMARLTTGPASAEEGAGGVKPRKRDASFHFAKICQDYRRNTTKLKEQLDQCQGNISNMEKMEMRKFTTFDVLVKIIKKAKINLL